MTEPIEYKELEREFFNMFNFIEEQAGVNEREHLKSFIQANFIPKSEIKEAIEKSRIKNDEVDQFKCYNTEGNLRMQDGYNQALSDLKSTLKL